MGMLALFLYTFECFSVTIFSALMYRFYHFESYRVYLKHFLEEYASFFKVFPVPDFYGVVVCLLILVSLVVLLSALLITTYYKRLHPRLTMFSIHRKGRHRKQEEE